ncbi:YihY/virulence factor BrkB family protein [Leucobacter insecticola]|uniref:YihY/virulence factor BrkB family protein n=1 Tax=Leucobacter insecticola TaxID=2714934 RepID=A0A6G8FH30_9MICO|nr:YhjD/YihY/BrkB family envelope integrity protein [Leucobacter insecticola]QIM15770.1 YihY/virulence factor BrkB family protein [Leucobacter insecticola]
MTTPREPSSRSGESSGASSRVAETVERGRGVWAWVQTTRAWRAISHFTDVGGNVLSGGMSYQALFAVFAGLWVGFGIFGIWLRERPELLDTIVTQINTFIPGLLEEGGTRGAVSINVLLGARVLDWTSIAAGLALVWVATNWFTGTRRSIRIIFGLEVKQYRSALLLKLRDLALAMGFFLAILVSAAFTVMSSSVADSLFSWLGVDADSWFFGTLGTILRYGAMYVFDVLVLIAMHRFLAEVRVPRWSLLRGCVLGGAALLLLKILGSAILGGASSNALLAIFAVFIGLLLWFNFICRVLLLTAAWISVGQNPEFGLPKEGAGALRLLG